MSGKEPARSPGFRPRRRDSPAGERDAMLVPLLQFPGWTVTVAVVYDVDVDVAALSATWVSVVVFH